MSGGPNQREAFVLWLKEHFPVEARGLIRANYGPWGLLGAISRVSSPFKAGGLQEHAALDQLGAALSELFSVLPEPRYSMEVLVDLPYAPGVSVHTALTTYREQALSPGEVWVLRLVGPGGNEINRVSFTTAPPPLRGPGAHEITTTKGREAYTGALAKELRRRLVGEGLVSRLQASWKGKNHDSPHRILSGGPGGAENLYGFDLDYYAEVKRSIPGKYESQWPRQTFTFNQPGSKWPRDPEEVAAEVAAWIRANP